MHTIGQSRQGRGISGTGVAATQGALRRPEPLQYRCPVAAAWSYLPQKERATLRWYVVASFALCNPAND